MTRKIPGGGGWLSCKERTLSIRTALQAHFDSPDHIFPGSFKINPVQVNTASEPGGGVRPSGRPLRLPVGVAAGSACSIRPRGQMRHPWLSWPLLGIRAQRAHSAALRPLKFIIHR